MTAYTFVDILQGSGLLILALSVLSLSKALMIQSKRTARIERILRSGIWEKEE